jgi:hypothetical protein
MGFFNVGSAQLHSNWKEKRAFFRYDEVRSGKIQVLGIGGSNIQILPVMDFLKDEIVKIGGKYEVCK